MSYIIINHSDNRYETLKKGFNLRFPQSGQDASAIFICQSEDDIEQALRDCTNLGMRPTVRSGGNCYEGFVSNNPGGVIIDIGLYEGITTNVSVDGADYAYKLAAGTKNWNNYVEMYKRAGVTVPGGSCYGVGVGGHISGGGFGYLSRLHGVVADWVSAIDILTVDVNGQVLRRHINAQQDADLFRACLGAGLGNFGIVLNYYFQQLPLAPTLMATKSAIYNWNLIDKASFQKILQAFGAYMEGSGQSDITSRGLFAVMKLNHSSAGSFAIRAHYCDTNGGLEDTAAYNDFWSRFTPFQSLEDTSTANYWSPYEAAPTLPVGNSLGMVSQDSISSLPSGTRVMDWLWFAQQNNGHGANQFGKYNSSYMKKNFTDFECATIYKWLMSDDPDGNLSQSLLQVDSYGGRINDQELVGKTLVPQRSSIMKTQFQTYWTDPEKDDFHLSWIKNFYAELYGSANPDAYFGTPYPYIAGNLDKPNPRYEGTYINYPCAEFADMGEQMGGWPILYYMDEVAFLKKVKQQYDPANHFRYALSIPLP